MTTITILGSGTVARTLAGPLRQAGHHITVGSRDPQRAASAWEGTGIGVASLPAAAAAAEVVVNALPGSASPAALGALTTQLTGKVLIDVANAIETDDAGLVRLRYPKSSLAEEIQRALPEARVVKTLNTVHDSVMADPTRLATPPAAFLSGNDAAPRRSPGIC